jgi:hypothetical protein
MDQQQTHEQQQQEQQNQEQSSKSSLSGFIREESGKPSSSRLLILVWGVGVFGIWAFSSVKSASLQSIPESVITILAALVSAKTIQRFGEHQ